MLTALRRLLPRSPSQATGGEPPPRGTDAERSYRRLRRGDGFLVMIRMRLGRLVGVVLGVQIVGARKMRVMAGGFVITAGRMPGGFAMVMRGALVMLGGMFVMFGGAFGVSHCRLLILPASCGPHLLAPSCDRRATRPLKAV